jgi:energy-coupling factor transport system permease protein
MLLVIMWLVTATTSPLQFADSMDSFSRKLPWLRIAGLGVILSIAIRFIPFFFEEAQRLRKAQMSRGLELTGGPLARVRGFIPILVPLFAGALRKADNLAVALEARCYDPMRRKPFVEHSFGTPELLTLSLCSACAAMAVVLKLW